MVFIRTDANEQIGTGHVMRCLSIARAFEEAGENVTFITADHRADEMLAGYASFCLDSDWTDMESELPRLLEIIKQTKPVLLLIDSYRVTKQYFKSLREVVYTAYIDDLNTARWDVDYLINYNIYASVCDYLQYDQTRTKLLLSLQYVPLRAEFIGLPKHEIKENMTDVLVSAGGADPERITEKLMVSVCPAFPELRFHFIIGALNARKEEIKKLSGKNVVLHINEHNLSKLMVKCDAAISAAGTTLYELCASGIPTIMFTLANNQINAALQFDKLGIMRYIGDCRNNELFSAQTVEELKKLCFDFRQKQSKKMQSLVDGLGAERIAKALLQNSMNI